MKTSQLTVADNIAGDDLLQIVDVNDPTMNVVTGTNKRITATLASNQLFNLVDANSVVTKISTATNTFSGDRLADTSVSGSKLASATITNSNIAGNAAIALSKLATGTLPVDIKIVSNNITDGTIVNADINDSANIALTKLATGTLPAGITINSSNIVNASIALTKLANGVLPAGITLDPTNAPTASPNFGTQILTSGGLTASRDANVILSANRHDATTEGPELNLIKTRGTIAAPVIVNSADELGDIAFAGYNGLNNQRAASIRAFADGAPSSSSIFPSVRIDKVGTEGTGAFGGTTTITTVNSPSQITINSATPNTVGPVTFRTLYSGTITVLTSTTATITGLATTAGLFVGQVLRRDGGAGAFGNTATISSVDSSSQITISSTTANTAGAIVFDYIATGTISASTASTTITGITSTTAGFYPGQKLRKIVGAGDFGGITTVVSVDSSTQLTISSTTANTLGSLTFACGWSGNISASTASTTITGITSGFSVAGRLTFNTTSSGNTGVDERMRITSTGNVGIGTATPTAKLNVVDNSSSDALRITQTGSGNALVVEDSANPDATPFVIDGNGVVGIGTTTPQSNFGISAGLGIQSSIAFAPNITQRNKTSDASAPYYVSQKDRAGAIVQSGDALGNIFFQGYDGASYQTAATIASAVDGTPGVNDMPGRLVFSTTADGSVVPSERMRIDNAGNVGIGKTAATGIKLDVNGTVAATAFRGRIDDSNGNELIAFPTAVASAVNEITISNAISGAGPTISATGVDTNINLNLSPKGTGIITTNSAIFAATATSGTNNTQLATTAYVQTAISGFGGVGGGDVTLAGIQTLTNKTLTSPTISDSIVFEGSSADDFETTLTVVNPTADRMITLPNATGTIVTTGDTGSVTSTMILNGTIVDADINASAAIVDTKLATISSAGKVSNSATTATSDNTPNAIAARNSDGAIHAATAAAGSNTTQLATTAYVQNAISTSGGTVNIEDSNTIIGLSIFL
jgi:hypothetical protein